MHNLSYMFTLQGLLDFFVLGCPSLQRKIVPAHKFYKPTIAGDKHSVQWFWMDFVMDRRIFIEKNRSFENLTI